MYYFAYGSNMSHKQMKQRCPSSIFLRAACLFEFKFVYDGYSKSRKGAVGNIVYDKESFVWGGLYEINKDNEASLDCYEGYPNSYDKKLEKVKDELGNIYEALVYLRKAQVIGLPSEEYLETIKKGAEDCKLPNSYINCLGRRFPSSL